MCKTMYTKLAAVLLVCAVSSSANARSTPETFANLAEELLPAVVNISTTAVTKRDLSKKPEIPQFPPGSPFEEFFREY